MSKRQYCPHCEEEVSYRVYKRHRKEFYNDTTMVWTPSEDPCDSLPCEMTEFTNDNESYESLPSFVDIESQTDISTSDHVDDDHEILQTLEEEDLLYFKDPAYEDNEFLYENNIQSEIWDNVTEKDLREDFVEKLDGSRSELFVLANVDEPESSKLLTLLNWFCLFLAYMWYFHNLSDVCMAMLLGFLKTFFVLLANVFPCLGALSTLLPGSLHKLRKHIGSNQDKFTKFVACRKCHAIYEFDKCYKSVGNQNVSATCTFIEFPGHRQKKQRQPCGELLLKEVELQGKRKRLYPFKVYGYQSVKTRLTNLLQVDGFAKKCEQWRKRKPGDGILADVYDGRIWKEYQHVNGEPFLAAPKNYAFQLNLDWFTPFKHVPYSVGALYMVVLNLPRAERYKKENAILVGLLPGPREPSLNVNSYITPLVEELNTLWTDGLTCDYTESGKTYNDTFHAALLSVVSDVPATRKLCGFVGHMARKGCSKCEKEFLTGAFGEKINFGGFEPVNHRHNLRHRHQAEQVSNATTKAQRDRLSTKYGSRYTALLKLQYFDCVRFHVVDPLHNLFLGTGKYIMKNVWLNKEKPKISKDQLEIIQTKIDNTKVPSDMGRMPLKIATSFGGFTADQWKHWITLFSVFSLKDVLPRKDFEMWRLFVLACNLLCAPVISIRNVGKGHSYLMNFCRQFEQLYGSQLVTPNMHYHAHLADCILDYGPVYSFWTFPFERFNGILGEGCGNQRSIEIQIMRKFLNEQFLSILPRPVDLEVDFSKFFPQNVQAGSVAESACDYDNLLKLSCLARDNIACAYATVLKSVKFFVPIGPFHMEYFDDAWLSNLKEMYKIVFSECEVKDVSGYVKQFAAVKLFNDVLGSENSRYSRSSLILASWCTLGGQIDTNLANDQPGIIEFFFTQFLTIDGKQEQCMMAKVRWFQKHPSLDYYGKPVEVWCPTSFEMSGPASFIPVQRIKSKFIAGFDKIKRERIMCVIPRPLKIYI
ncbi:uncharacterized protein LOC144354095 [Saccoglossus kowalevskii]